tara:strand:+ start:163 stop:420 length:258 start_codon:yes stop_codon:yes gene_type:complete
VCEYHLRILSWGREFGEISNIESIAGSEPSFYTFLVYWVTYGLNSVSFFDCPTATAVRESLWIGIILIIILFIFLGVNLSKKNQS